MFFPKGRSLLHQLHTGSVSGASFLSIDIDGGVPQGIAKRHRLSTTPAAPYAHVGPGPEA